MNQEQWVYDSEGNGSCLRHPTEPGFIRGEVCYACASDPGPRIDVIAAAAEDVEGRAAEAEVREVAKRNKRIADELAAEEGRDLLAAPKFYEVYLKSMRLWREMRTVRMDKEFKAGLVEHDRAIAGLRGPN